MSRPLWPPKKGDHFFSKEFTVVLKTLYFLGCQGQSVSNFLASIDNPVHTDKIANDPPPQEKK